MYYTLGFKKNIENCIKLISTKETNKFTSLLEIKKSLGRYIDQVQPQSKIDLSIQELPVMVSSLEQKAVLASAFSIQSRLNDLAQASMIEDLHFPGEALFQQHLYSAIRIIEAQNPELAALIKIVFRYLLFGKSSKAHGGSTSAGLGILWLNPTEKWTTQDYCEFLVHELTHQLLFLDERVYGHYTQYSKIAHKENFAFSTILKRSRPLDKVIHSYFVGQNILTYRDIFWTDKNSVCTLHPNRADLVEGLHDTRSSIKQHHWGLMTPRLNDLIKKHSVGKAETITA